MSGIGAFGLLWAASGILLGTLWWRERETEPSRAGGAQGASSQRYRFGAPLQDGSGRRLQAMRLAYAAGTLATGAGFLLGLGVLLALGAALVNLGTIYRYLVVALDQEALDTPLLPGATSFLLADVLDQPAT